MEDTSSRKKRGWIWATFFTVMGIIYVTDGLRSPETEMGRLLMGAGFLLAAPQAFFSPISFANPDLKFIKVSPVDWLGMAGVLLLVSGLVVRWL
ncbi:hypothetical protein [Stenotrophomonas pictorum]|nr:hypothetical protein [Stenotrophomonas pictorum]